MFREKKPLNLKKCISILIAIAILSIAFCSTVYIVHEMHHNCQGKDCPVCAAVAECESALRQFSQDALFCAVDTVFLTAVLAFACAFRVFIAKKTLVLQKVRLND